jgi:AsmA-like C-terminal region
VGHLERWALEIAIMHAALAPTKTKRRIRITEWITLGAIMVAMVCVHLMFFFWPFRYRQVHPLLEQVFESRVVVVNYHRIYFPHPGFVAEDITFYRHGDTHIPPLAMVKRMTVEGQWGMLLFHPHLLYQIRLQGLHVQIPPSGTKARGMDFDNGVVDTSQSKMVIETIVADGTTLDFLRKGDTPIRFKFPALQIHDLRAGRSMRFSTLVTLPGPPGTVVASGLIGPFRTNSYATTPVKGNYKLLSVDLSRLQGLAGHAEGQGEFKGNFTRVVVNGMAVIPDFRADGAHTVRLDAHYSVTVNATNADVAIDGAEVRTGSSVITAIGSVAGSPRLVALTIATKGAQVEDLLKIVQNTNPQVTGKVNFEAAVQLQGGPEGFLQRLQLKGDASLDGMRLVNAKEQQTEDAFSARVRKDGPGDGDAGNPPVVGLEARSATRFDHGMAYFPDIHATVPGADAHLHGTFNLLDKKIHLTGTVALEKGISHAATGWKAMMLKPLTPFFRKKDAGAVVPIAVTGTAKEPRLGSDLLHDK